MLDPGEVMPLRGDDPIGGVDESCNAGGGEQPAGAWTQGGGQRVSQRRTGGVDVAIGVRDVEGSAALGCRERRHERVGFGTVKVEQDEGVTAVEAAPGSGAYAAERAVAFVESNRAVPHPHPRPLREETAAGLPWMDECCGRPARRRRWPRGRASCSRPRTASPPARSRGELGVSGPTVRL